MKYFDEHQLDELLFDYFEGNLDATQKAALEEYVQSNPEAQVEFNAWQSSYVQSEEVDYPLAAEMLSSGTGSIWLKWTMGFLLFAGTAFSLFLITDGISGKERARMHHQALAMAYNDNQSGTVVLEVALSDEPSAQSQQGNHQVTSDAESVAEAEPVDSNDGQLERASSYAGHNTGHMSSQKNPSNIAAQAKATTHSIFPPEAGFSRRKTGGMGNYSSMAADDALLEAMEYFTSENFKNERRYTSDHDDHLENRVYHAERESRMKRFAEKLAKTFRQPLGIVNLKDPYYPLPNYRSAVAQNPSFAGSMLTTRMELSAQGRWLSSNQEGAIAGHIALDGYSKLLRSGLGLTMDYQQYADGRISDIRGGLIVSPKFKLNRETTLEAALKYSVGTCYTNWNEIPASGMHEFSTGYLMPNQPLGADLNQPRRLYHDLSAGLLLNAKKFYVGVSADQLLMPAVSHLAYAEEVPAEDFRLKPVFHAQLGTDYRFHSNYQVVISPYLMFRHSHGESETSLGTFTRLNHFIAGASVSTKMNFTAMAGMQIKNFRLGYLYSRTHSALYNRQFSAHEVSMRILFGQRTGAQPILKYE